MIGNRLPLLRQQLEPYSDTASLDAQVLLAHLLEKPRAWVLAHPEALLTSAQEQSLTQAVERLQNGEPLPYVLGEWEFFGLSFQVTPAVLIPRPETELLVEQALKALQARPHLLSTASQQLCLADIGTGSGCIAISLAVHLPGIQILATDLSNAALQVARLNALRHQVSDRTPLPASRPAGRHRSHTHLPPHLRQPSLHSSGGSRQPAGLQAGAFPGSRRWTGRSEVD